uniref:Uncharacterized protein n=1 Tax=Steinernema glaseri TaxID=37863 RepID=A0A1I7YIV8_9BILA
MDKLGWEHRVRKHRKSYDSGGHKPAEYTHHTKIVTAEKLEALMTKIISTILSFTLCEVTVMRGRHGPYYRNLLWISTVPRSSYPEGETRFRKSSNVRRKVRSRLGASAKRSFEAEPGSIPQASGPGTKITLSLAEDVSEALDDSSASR